MASARRPGSEATAEVQAAFVELDKAVFYNRATQIARSNVEILFLACLLYFQAVSNVWSVSALSFAGLFRVLFCLLSLLCFCSVFCLSP